ncbi:MAG: TrmJ/YjtD family RNA methyltransferase [Bryobacterales bacterium]|nr:TrmJ/YjtD family RNA methyltransferase [Bryobacterales bacterium]
MPAWHNWELTDAPPPANLSVVLVHPRNPLNIGAAARAMSNFGFFDLRLVQPYDVAFREAKSAVNASPVMEAARVFESVAEAVADCSLIAGTTGGDHREPSQLLYRLEAGAKRIAGHAGRTAILFGSEKYGLSNDDMSHCHWLMRIPSRPEHSSMNLGQAVAVCLYEFIRSDAASGAPISGRRFAASEHTEAIVAKLQAVLEASGYYEGTNTAGAVRRLRNVVKRIALNKQDAVIVLGMLRQIQWRLKNK